MNDKKPLTSKTSNYIFIGIGLIISAIFILFLTPMIISMILALFRPEPLDLSKIFGMFVLGSILTIIPIHFISIAYRMKHIYTSESGLYFNGQSIFWNKISKITIFLGNSGRFTIKYNIEGKPKKVFGSLMTFERKSIINTLHKIADDHNISLSKLWL